MVEVAAGLLAAEWAVYKRRGRDLPVQPREQFAENVAWQEEDPEGNEEQGVAQDDVQAMRLLRVAANYHASLVAQDLPDELVAEYKRLATPEGCYERACKLGCENLEWEWLVIEALAECLLQEGYLTGEDVEVIIKAVQAEEEA